MSQKKDKKEEEERKGVSAMDVLGALKEYVGDKVRTVGDKVRTVAARGIKSAADLLLPEAEVKVEDPKANFENECKEANEYLIFNSGCGLPRDEISATYLQLQNKEVTISTHGRHSCGKSTLLNALLDDSLLPTCLENNTGVKVEIKHSDSVHQGMCPNPMPCEWCPQLEVKWVGDRSRTQIVHGTSDVRTALEKLNKSSRKSTTEVAKTGIKECILTAYVPKLAAVELGWRISLLDNPGYGEADQESMMLETETTMKTSSALLYVMDVGQLQDKEDARCLKQLYKADEGIFTDSNRLTVAVTQFDKTYDDSREWSKEEIQGKVCTFIERQIGRKVPRKVVIPVCGKWAFEARQLKQHQDNTTLKRRVRAHLLECPSAPGGQESMSQGETPRMLADTLLSVTGIETLESRIQMMASVCVCTWASSISQKYHNYLEIAGQHFESSIKETSANLAGAEKLHSDEVRLYNKVIHLSDSLVDKSVLQELHQRCGKDVEAAKASAMKVLESFHEQCHKVIKAQRESFGPKEFESKVKVLLQEEISEKLCAAVFDASCGFKLGWTVRKEAISKMQKNIGVMKQAAEMFLALKPTEDVFDESCNEEFKASVEVQEIDNLEGIFKGKKLTFDNFKEKVKIPELDLSWSRWFAKGFWWWTSRLKLSSPPIYTYSSTDCVAEAMKQTNSYVQETLESYLEGLEQRVAEFFFSNYREITDNHLSSFEKKYKDRLEEKKMKGDKHVEEVKATLELLKEEKKRVQQLQERLKRASKKYIDVIQLSENRDDR